jgi:hypothetical protein
MSISRAENLENLDPRVRTLALPARLLAGMPNGRNPERLNHHDDTTLEFQMKWNS